MVLVVGGYWLGSTIQCHSRVAISHQTRRSRVRCGGWMDGSIWGLSGRVRCWWWCWWCGEKSSLIRDRQSTFDFSPYTNSTDVITGSDLSRITFTSFHVHQPATEMRKMQGRRTGRSNSYSECLYSTKIFFFLFRMCDHRVQNHSLPSPHLITVKFRRC